MQLSASLLPAPAAARALAAGWAAGAGRSFLFHAGWLAMAQLGMVLSWSWFGGLALVALWWCAMAMLAGTRPVLPHLQRLAYLQRLPAWVLAALAALALACAMLGGRSGAAAVAAVAACLAWATLCSRAGLAWERGPHRGLHREPHDGSLGCALRGPQSELTSNVAAEAAHGLGLLAGLAAAAALAAHPGEWLQRWPVVCAALPVATWLAQRTQPSAPAAHGLDAPMGLMMGGLLLAAEACRSLGWGPQQSVLMHGGAMLLGLMLARSLGRETSIDEAGWRALRPSVAPLASPIHGIAEGGADPQRRARQRSDGKTVTVPWPGPALLWAGAAAFVAWDLPQAMLVAAVLMGAASCPRASGGPPSRWQAVLGAALLLLAGQASAAWGPDALRWALLAGLGLALWGHRRSQGH